MAMIDKVNGKIRVNCIIMTRGVIPNFAGVMGPILQPRPIELNDVLILLRKGVDVRAVERNNRQYKLDEAVVLNEQLVLSMVDEFKNGKKPVNKVKPNNKPVQQQPKQQVPVQQQPKPVVEEKPKEVVVEKQAEPAKVEEPVVKQQEQPKQEQQPKVNNKNKNNKNNNK